MGDEVSDGCTVAAALDAAGCERVAVKSGDKPIAALWHVFRPQDADRIRSFVDKVRLLITLIVVIEVVIVAYQLGQLHNVIC